MMRKCIGAILITVICTIGYSSISHGEDNLACCTVEDRFAKIVSSIQNYYIRDIDEKILVDNALINMYKVAGLKRSIDEMTVLNEPVEYNLKKIYSRTDLSSQIKRWGYELHSLLQMDLKADQELLFLASVEGMLSTLDTHCRYLTQETYKRIQQHTIDPSIGIGVIIENTSKGMRVISVFHDSPAYRSGIRPNDMITKLAGHPTKGMSPTQAFDFLNGEPGSNVVLELAQEINPPKILSVAREKIPSQPISKRLLSKNIGYIRIGSLPPGLESKLEEALTYLMNECNIKALILDLRDNPGGMLLTAIKCTDMFCNRDALGYGLILETVGRNTDDFRKFRFTKKLSMVLPQNVPIAVLVNKGTSAGAEIMAACLQDHKRAVIVGSKTEGNGTIQTAIPLEGGDALKLTVAQIQRPSGEVIEGKGVIPDFCVQNGHVDQKDINHQCGQSEEYYYDDSHDPELEIAMGIINGKLSAIDGQDFKGQLPK